jgi:hypothetical protein
MNTHIHLPPNFSAFDTVADAVEAARAEGIALLGASNYYDFTVYHAFGAACRAARIHPLFGIEIVAKDENLARAGALVNDPGNPGRVYLCGKAIVWWDAPCPSSAEILAIIRSRDATRAEEMSKRLADCFLAGGLDVALDAAAIVERVARRSGVPSETVVLQERHIARAFQEELFRAVGPESRNDVLERVYTAPPKAAPDDAAGVQGEIRSRLLKAGRPAYVPEDFVSVEEAIALVEGLGGIPCYPVLADGASPTTPFEADADALIEDLRGRGIAAAEFIPVRNEPEVLERYVPALAEAGFLVTAGTEHNTLDRIPLAPACRRGQALPEAVREVFDLGALALAGHADQVSRGRPGYGAGPTVPELAKIGRSVMERLREA